MDNKDINSKSTPNQMRVFMKRMRDGKFEVNETNDKSKKNLSMRDMLKITRKLNEDVVPDEKKDAVNKETVYDQPDEEQKFINFFKNADLIISAKFIDLEVYETWVFWGGEVDGVVKFIYSVTPDENTSVVELDYLEDFSPDNPNNELIAKIIKEYYNTFKKYWRENIISTKTT